MSTPTAPISASALSGVKLRPSKIQKDASAPLFEGTLEREGLDDYQNTVLDMNIEVWYPLIAEPTFPSKFYPLTFDDAKLLMSCYQTRVINKQPLSTEQKNRLEILENGLQKVIDDVRGSDPCVFVKTSCRSPKDTVVYADRFRELYRYALSQKPMKSENDKLASLLEAAIDLLKTHSAKELLESFCTSERIFQDMSLATSHSDRFVQNFVVRKWVTVLPDMEFRGFFCNGKLNALSQYNHCCYYPRVADHADSLANRIQEFFYSKVEPKLKSGKIESCVVDFAVIGDDEIYVVELNPFVYTTDGCLFSWTHERSILEKGPFEFRYQQRECPGSLVSIADAWKQVVQEEDSK